MNWLVFFIFFGIVAGLIWLIRKAYKYRGE